MEIISNHEVLTPPRNEQVLGVEDYASGSEATHSAGTGPSEERDERNYTSEEDSEEWEDDVVVCEDWTVENDAIGPLFDPDDENTYSRCDRPLDMSGVPTMPSNRSNYGHGPTRYVLIPKNEYIMDNLELFHAMCRIEDLDFENMETEAQERLMKTVVVEKYKLKEYILNDGDAGNDFFFIVSDHLDQDGQPATAEVIKNGRTVTRLFCGQIFGEKNFLTNSNLRKRNASVCVVPEFSVFTNGMIILEKKDGEVVEAETKKEGDTGTDIAVARVKKEHFPLWKQMRENMIVSLIPAFRSFNKRDLGSLLSLCEEEHFEPGERMMTEGEEGSKMFFVLVGTFTVSRGDMGLIAKLHPGHCIGEMAVIFDERRYASVDCLEQATCLSLTKEAFNTACLMDKGFKTFIKDIMDKRKEVRKKREALSMGKIVPSAFLSSGSAGTTSFGSNVPPRRVLFPVSSRSESSTPLRLSQKINADKDSKSSSNSCKDGRSCSGSPSTNSAPLSSNGNGASEIDTGCSSRSSREKENASRWVRTPDSTATPLGAYPLTPPSRGSMMREPPVTMTKTLTSHKTREGQRVLNDKYTVIRSIGKGSFGEVWEVRDPADNVFAMKCLRCSSLSRYEMAAEDMHREIAIMSKLRHPNVVALFEVIDDSPKGKIYLIQEMMQSTLMPMPAQAGGDGGAKMEPIESERCRSYFRDIVRGVAYLHSCDVVHRDIKPQNILVSADGVAKIGDFGASVFTGGLAKSKYQGTPAFTAPELSIPKEFREHDFTCMPTIDIFAMGATLFYMATGSLPWTARTQVSLAAKIRNLEPRFPPDMDIHLKHLLQRMLDKDYSTRITIGEVEYDDWVTKEGAEPLYQYLYWDGDKENEQLSLPSSFIKAASFREESPVLALGSANGINLAETCGESSPGVAVMTTELLMATLDGVPVPSDTVKSGPRTRIVLVRDPGILVDLLHTSDGAIATIGSIPSGLHQVSSDRREQEHLSRTLKATQNSLTGYITGMESNVDGQRALHISMRKPPSPVGTFFWKRCPNAPQQGLCDFVASSNSFYDSPVRTDYSAESSETGEEEVVELLLGDDIDSEFDRLAEASIALTQQTFLEAEWHRRMDFPDGLPPKFSHLKTATQGSFRGKISNLGLKSIKYENLRLGIRVGLATDIGNRPAMEDRLLCAPNCSVPREARQQGFEDIAMLGVFDGHGDCGAVSDLLSECAETAFLRNLGRTCEETAGESGESQLHRSLEDTVKFLELQTLFEKQSKFKEASNLKTHALRVGGSTATILTVSKLAGSSHLSMVGCSVGDSKAVISRSGDAVVLSAEHRVGSSNEGERERVLAAGGEITRDRIFSDLQLSRSIGDLNYKHEGMKLVKLDKLEPQSLSHKEIKRIIEPLWAADQVIISKPSFWKQEIDTDIDEFVILASDGLFDHVAPQEAVNFVRYSLLNNQHLQIAAQELSDLAIRRASVAADNVGILIVAFKQTERLDKH